MCAAWCATPRSKHRADRRAAPAPAWPANRSAPGLIVDLSRHFRHILDVGADTVRVQPGVACRHSTRSWRNRPALRARSRQRRPCAPSAACWPTTLPGPRAVKYGYTRDHVLSLSRRARQRRRGRIARRRCRTRRTDASSHLHDIVTRWPSCSSKSRTDRDDAAAHALQSLRLSPGRCARKGRRSICRGLLVGSEGTLAIFTEATLRTIPLPAGRAVVLGNSPVSNGAIQAAQQCCRPARRRAIARPPSAQAGSGQRGRARRPDFARRGGGPR